MKSKETPFRAVGQRSIASSLLNSSSNRFKVAKQDDKNEALEKGSSRLSLSEFLHRKLHDSSGLPRIMKGKSKPFSSFVNTRESSVTSDEHIEAKKRGEAETSSVIEKAVLEQFKHSDSEQGDCVGSSSVGEEDICNTDEPQESRKRKNFEGGSAKNISRKPFVVLGGNLKPKQQRREESIISKEPAPFYNHYKNGGGWWDNNMEGVDNEEVGFSEVWEGVGSTTFGGIVDWH
ncbi:hypothetical protein UlMin_010268 [Ulmus minor]